MTIDLPRSEAPRVSIIVVATSKFELLAACLRSVARSAPRELPFETIVVLNKAGPDDEARLRATATGLKIARSPLNFGFASAGNRGRAMATAELLLLLHDDAEVEAGWMEALVEAADAHPTAGAIGSKVLHLDGRLQSAGFILWRDASTSPPWAGEAPSPDAFDRLRAVDYCGTSSLLVRAAAWDAAGGLDPAYYPLYYTDVDLGMALRKLGFVVLCQPASRIRHHQGATSNPRFRIFTMQRNRQIFIEKWRAALDRHEPRAPESAVAVERALQRAEAFAEECRRRGAPAVSPSPREAEPLEMFYERSRLFQEAYIEHLTQALKQMEQRQAQIEEWERILRSRSALFRRLFAMLLSGKRGV
ncbi:MAG: glycosyltransferase family 2 protein [Xanthobacteraceae bacterium]|nr:glycosyltransferase family 2 protein [Xanthobacteraceae bacterium]